MVEFSFIIPHKNTPELLQRCLNSIPERDDCEIIVIDDASDPEKVDFDNFPGKDRNNVSIIYSKDKKGAGHARNLGLEKASGNWLVFADADDYFTKELGNILTKYAGDKATDIVFLNAEIFDDDYNTRPFILSRFIDNYLRRGTDSESILRYQIWTPWSRMIKRSIATVNNIRFEETRIANDAFFILNATSKAKKIAAERNIVYEYYRPQQGSITDSYYKQDIAMFRLELKLRVNKFYKEHSYCYLWPIQREIKILGLKNNAEVKELLKKYEFSKFEDIFVTYKYVFAKLIKRL